MAICHQWPGVLFALCCVSTSSIQSEPVVWVTWRLCVLPEQHRWLTAVEVPDGREGVLQSLCLPPIHRGTAHFSGCRRNRWDGLGPKRGGWDCVCLSVSTWRALLLPSPMGTESYNRMSQWLCILLGADIRPSNELSINPLINSFVCIDVNNVIILALFL